LHRDTAAACPSCCCLSAAAVANTWAPLLLVLWAVTGVSTLFLQVQLGRLKLPVAHPSTPLGA
jgi:hypothetical protein